MTGLSAEIEFSELVDASVPRVDLVSRAANGSAGFLLMKQDAQAGLMDPDVIRDLIGKSQPTTSSSEETVTMTGTPGAIAKMIHDAAQRRAEEPATVTPDLHGSVDRLREHLGVAKATDLDDSTDGMDITTPLAEPDMDAPGSPTDPGSPAWEAIDAATARKWTSILARAKVAVDMLAEREMLEAATGDEDDMANAFDLQDACYAIDYAISILAPFAVDEQSEADCGDMMQMVGKALASFDPAPLDTIEALGQVRKAGRVLSTANEAAIRGAVDSLQKVLASLPAAPTAPDDGQSVAKEQETDMPEPQTAADATAESGQEPEMGIAKADGDKTPMVVVYDQKGRLIGIVDPGDVTPVANAEADADDMDAAAPDDDGEPAEATPETTDLTPEPPAEAGTPADAVPDDQAVTKTTTDTEMFKSSLLAAVESAFTEHSANQNTVLAKQADAVLELASMVETLKGRIGTLEEQPAMPKVFTNGAVPPRDVRGMDRSAGNAQIDVAKARERKDALYKAADATEQNRIAQDMQASAIDALQAIHQQRR